MAHRAVVVAIALALAAPGRCHPQRIRLPASLASLEERAVKDSKDAAAHYNFLGIVEQQLVKPTEAHAAFTRFLGHRLEPL